MSDSDEPDHLQDQDEDSDDESGMEQEAEQEAPAVAAEVMDGGNDDFGADDEADANDDSDADPDADADDAVDAENDDDPDGDDDVDAEAGADTSIVDQDESLVAEAMEEDDDENEGENADADADAVTNIDAGIEAKGELDGNGEGEGEVDAAKSTPSTPAKEEVEAARNTPAHTPLRTKSGSIRKKPGPKPGKRKNREGDPPPKKKKKGIPSTKDLFVPFRAIKRIMKLDKDIGTVQNEAAMVATYAVEMFVEKMVNESHDNAKKRGRNTVKYEDLAEVRASHSNMSFLNTLIP